MAAAPRWLDLTLASPEENLALDEALLESAEEGALTHDVLRVWQTNQTFVVIGRASKIDEEVHLALCDERSIPVLRRSSGGAAIVTGPGCLMYSVVLSMERRPHLRSLDEAHRFVLSRIQQAIGELGIDVELRGTSDLALHGKKVSGNSLRCKRDHLLYHGTILCDFQIDLIGELLKTPPRQPDYREGRSHADFVCNLGLDAASLSSAIRRVWQADVACTTWPQEKTHELLVARYRDMAWHRER